MTPCLADTYFFLALLNSRDAAHVRAAEANRVDRPIVTTAWVLLELADHLCSSRNRALVPRLHQALRDDPRFEVISADQRTLDRAVELYASRTDKDWSLTDCTSFIVMQERQLREALTGDHHFAQAGFIPLLA